MNEYNVVILVFLLFTTGPDKNMKKSPFAIW